MKQVIDGTFIADGGYYGLLEATSRAKLNNIVESAYKKGTLLNVHLVVEDVGSRPLCKEQTKYSLCNEVLNADGTCPDVERHIEPEPEPEPDTSVTRIGDATVCYAP